MEIRIFFKFVHWRSLMTSPDKCGHKICGEKRQKTKSNFGWRIGKSSKSIKIELEIFFLVQKDHHWFFLFLLTVAFFPWFCPIPKMVILQPWHFIAQHLLCIQLFKSVEIGFQIFTFPEFLQLGDIEEDLFQYSQLYKYRSYVWVVDRKVIIGLAKVEEGEEEEKNRTPIILLFCCDNTIQAMRRYEGWGRAKGIFRSFFFCTVTSLIKKGN